VVVPIDVRLGAEERLAIARSVVTVVDGRIEGAEAGVALRSRHDLDAVAIVVHTSGSSGRPKPVELTYGNWLWSALGSAVALGLDPSERWLCTLPLSHVGGLSIILRSAIAATTAMVHERFRTERVLQELRRPLGPTIISLVPTTLQRLLDAGLREPPALRWALLGGAPVSPALLGRAAAAGVPVATTYGLTEACSQVTTLGAPLFCTRVALAADGEILVSGPTVAPASGPALRTGDLGEWNADGALHVAGRKADTIVTGGENVAPAEVEAVLEGHPAVAEAAVHGAPHAEWGEAVVATVVARQDVSEDELRAHCAARLAPFKVPKAIRFADGLPRTRSGKLIRGEL
jgi:O-succinylbenzoic acid--CoA ligase